MITEKQYKSLLKSVLDYLGQHDDGFKKPEAQTARNKLFKDIRNAINAPYSTAKDDGVLPVMLTMFQNGDSDSYRVSLVSEGYSERVVLDDSGSFEGAHMYLSDWATWFRERGCTVEIVDNSKVYAQESTE